LEVTEQSLGRVSLKGEIIDPKCFFGVMKPGFGKIHRSCATRCLSGGIPPVLVTIDDTGVQEYYILTDESGNRIDGEILQMVGKPSEISGELYKTGTWYQLRVSSEDIRLLAGDSRFYE
jgi:hypothetical protein